jgi:phospholipase C
MTRKSRREFFEITAKAAALQAAAGLPKLPAADDWLERFDHVVVLMMENRSFDTMLGHLYEPGAVPRGQSYEGVGGKTLTNPIPPGARDAWRRLVPVAVGGSIESPSPDPGEEYPAVNTQLYGGVEPAENSRREGLAIAHPYNLPDPVPARPPMNGFVTDYIHAFRRDTGRDPAYEEYAVILRCFAPESLPVLSTLARSFAVCDHWHCAVPSQTFTNRSFFHAGTSGGSVLNVPYAAWVRENDAETIFNRIDAKRRGLSWKVYFDCEDSYSLTALIHYPVLKNSLGTGFADMERFLEDARAGTLPSYAFIEPRFFLNHNDQHPPIQFLGKSLHSSVLAGEVLIERVYDAIRRSDNEKGSNFSNTLLVVTYDEHGGTYDHVPPPEAAPPEASAPRGQMGFRFDRLGVRVPAVLISAWIEPGTVVSTPLDHGSILRTMSKKWDLGHLTERDRASNDVGAAFNRGTPRPRESWPVVRARPMPRRELRQAANMDHPLNGLQRSVLGLATALGADHASPGRTHTVSSAIHTIRIAVVKAGFCRR